MLVKIGENLGLDKLEPAQRAQLGQELMNMAETAKEGIDAIVQEYRKGIDDEFAKFTEECKELDYKKWSLIIHSKLTFFLFDFNWLLCLFKFFNEN